MCPALQRAYAAIRASEGAEGDRRTAPIICGREFTAGALIATIAGLSALTIRRATPADAAALADFATRVFMLTFGPDNNQEDMDDYVTKTYGVEHQRREIEDPRVTTLLIESDGVLIAFAQMRVAPDEVEIARFYVDRPWHGRGVAQRMMRACLDVARDAGVPRVWLAVWEKNARAIAFYEKCGFRFTGSQLFILGKDVQTDRLMEMKIREATPSRP